jgi:hypothetical protein
MDKAFLAFKKQRENEKCSSHVQLREYNDAVLWGRCQDKSTAIASLLL